MKLVANYIVKLEDDFDVAVFRASVKQVRRACDRIVALNAQNGLPHNPAFDAIVKEFNIEHPHIFKEKVCSFAGLRNIALDYVDIGEWFYWIDSDEVAFSEYLVDLKNQLEIQLKHKQITQVRTRFVHFCVTPDGYERTEPRTTIMLKGPHTRWEGDVHERVVDVPSGKTLYSDYVVHHYGYCRPQRRVFNAWQMYAELEGDPNRYINEEVGGKTVPYFRPGEREDCSHILDDRIKTLIPFSGKYPDPSLIEFIKKYRA